jgi:hypothetical protein
LKWDRRFIFIENNNNNIFLDLVRTFLLLPNAAQERKKRNRQPHGKRQGAHGRQGVCCQAIAQRSKRRKRDDHQVARHLRG